MGTVLPKDTPILQWCEDDPLTTVTIIPTRLGGMSVDPEDAKRLIRLYFPRHLDKGSVDVLLFSAGDVVHFTSSQIASMEKSIEKGVGALADCGGTSAIQQFVDTWIASGIDSIFPNDASAVQSASYSFKTGTYPGYFLRAVPYRIRVNQNVPANPFLPFVAAGIEKVHGYAGRRMIAKSGSSTLAAMHGDLGFLRDGSPFALAWRYEGGRTATVSEWFGHPFWGDYGFDIHRSDNPYGQELFTSLLLYITGEPPFEDVVPVHQFKIDTAAFRVRRDNLLSAMEFASTFGANLVSVEKDLARIEKGKSQADSLYMEGDYAGASARVKSLLEDLNNAFDETLAMKNRALRYIFISEWLAVTAVLTLSGSLLHQLMIRRRVYREVSSTAARSS